jgi:hypothetical protein
MSIHRLSVREYVQVSQALLKKEIRGHHSLPSSSASATTLLPGQDKSAPPVPTSRSVWFVVSCGFRLSEVGFGGLPKPRVKTTPIFTLNFD